MMLCGLLVGGLSFACQGGSRPSCPPCKPCPTAPARERAATAAPKLPPAASQSAPGAQPSSDWAPATEAQVDTSGAQMGLQVARDLFEGRYDAVMPLFNRRLRAALDVERLEMIVRDVARFHGPPKRVVDAWETTIKEEERQLPAIAVHLVMENSATRFKLLLILDPNGKLDGLWLRPA